MVEWHAPKIQSQQSWEHELKTHVLLSSLDTNDAIMNLIHKWKFPIIKLLFIASLFAMLESEWRLALLLPFPLKRAPKCEMEDDNLFA